MVITPVFLIVAGLLILIFHRRAGLVGSAQRAWMRRWVPMPDDTFYILLAVVTGCAFVLGGAIELVVELSS